MKPKHWGYIVSFTLLTTLSALAFAHGGAEHSHDSEQKALPVLPDSYAKGTIGTSIYLPKESQFLFEVQTKVAQIKELRSQVRVLGKVVPRPNGEAIIFPPQSGIIFAPPSGKLPLPGEMVKKGDVIAILEGSLDAPDQVGLASSQVEARARVAAAEAKVAAAKRELTRFESLAGVVPEKEIQDANTQLTIAQAELTGAKKVAGIASNSQKANRYKIVAPLDGVIAEVAISVGSQIDPEHTLFRIIDFQKLWVKAQIFEDDLPFIQGASQALIRPEGLKERQFSGNLISLGQIIDEQARTVPILFEVENPKGELRVGMFVQVGILSGETITSIAIPKNAVLNRAGNQSVYVHNAPEFFTLRPVELGPEDGDSVAVLRGIQEGERVVVKGVSNIRVAGGQ